MAIALPDEAESWIESFRDRLNDNDAYAEAADGWGVDFDGDFVLEILADGTYDGEPLYFYLELRDGDCLQAAVLDDPDEVAHGYALRGTYTDWKRIIQGEVDIVSGVMDGTLEADGSKIRAMRYQQALVEMGETAARVETDFQY
ncbi:SCP2 sterol-binding domain-containing protein [Halapricum hydrolyticum]|uniref:SCP2 sterol-binding domain-containing protein n=1 Tax=Halapricum hydrolyticum TaxID=2979991 RepID=A0AAE3IDT4_9EURY|nr:SCP2 sterol-binding domain-containing protein [Halapricum hydrolyticum]MCU4719281.1 SCP2 sterol-binding domain-containing protein [Halapricum hydrolyticum]MCU4728156.1 SCP2 sterol-binding domain-containing protein [Halapricum hydrolyticum]